MEVIKTSPNVEFEVIYADGTRKRVREGLLCEAEPGGRMIFHNGTDRGTVWLAAAETMLVALNTCGALKSLAAYMTISIDSFATLKELTVDMFKAYTAMLESEDVDAQIISTLSQAAEMILAIEIPGGANE